MKEAHKLFEAMGLTFTTSTSNDQVWGHRLEPDEVRQPWSREGFHAGELPIREDTQQLSNVTFVDDVALAIVQKTARQLATSVPLGLAALRLVFESFGLVINWKPQKTEGMVRMHRRYADDALQQLVQNNTILVPGTPALFLPVVRSYRHLGTMFSLDCHEGLATRRREQSALAAFAPLSYRIFGSQYGVRCEVYADASSDLHEAVSSYSPGYTYEAHAETTECSPGSSFEKDRRQTQDDEAGRDRQAAEGRDGRTKCGLLAPSVPLDVRTPAHEESTS